MDCRVVGGWNILTPQPPCRLGTRADKSRPGWECAEVDMVMEARGQAWSNAD
jgi:hypothetical protein